jgi:transcriptional regulator with XRE-family HTH domain
MPRWNEALRALRRRRGLASRELASRIGISFESIRSYETARRRPPRAQLARILDCLAADRPSRNLIFTGAGFAPDTPIGRFVEPDMPPLEAVRLVDRRPAPALLLDFRADVVAGNAPARKLFGLPSGRAPRRNVHALTVAASHAFAEGCENWEAVAVQTIRIIKASGVAAETDEDAGALPPGIEALAGGQSARLHRFAELWAATPPRRDRLTGHAYPVIWRAGARSRIHLDCLMSCVNTDLGLFVHEYIPTDAKSHRALEKLLAGR